MLCKAAKRLDAYLALMLVTASLATENEIMNAFIERHFALCLAVALPFAAVAGVAAALALWELTIVPLEAALRAFG